ncbi:MAG: hypothetical protein M3Z17_04175 [Gemmatimonadota bacterium]|nr:hypothetical protein [Gemmatimonadota bacterium]
MVARRGGSTIGCLLPLLIGAIVVYVGRDFGEAYFRFYQFRDAMHQEARFAQSRPDDLITTHLRALADSLDLPRNAGQVRISRRNSAVTIWSDYEETIKLPLNHEKAIHFHPTSETSF